MPICLRSYSVQSVAFLISEAEASFTTISIFGSSILMTGSAESGVPPMGWVLEETPSMPVLHFRSGHLFLSHNKFFLVNLRMSLFGVSVILFCVSVE